MALLTTASEANRVVDTALSVSYSRRRIYGLWTHVGLNVTTVYTSAWEYTRTATKSYRYVGMTEDAARTAAASLVTLYTRSTKVSEWDEADGEFDVVSAGDIPMADVVRQHEGGEMWSVVVSVHEQDSRISLSADLSMTTIFSTENARDYDENEEEESE